MKYIKDLPEGFGWETAETKWVSWEEGLKMLAYGNEKKLLQKANGLLEANIHLE